MASVTLTWKAPETGATPTKYTIYKLASTTAGTENEDDVVSGGTEIEITPDVGQTEFTYTDTSVTSSAPGPYYSYTVTAGNNNPVASAPHDPAVIADLS